ncbi:MAG: FKBP-type peptidyl-prolyl cis-trans isomerase [Putridiphycobacter sp.]
MNVKLYFILIVALIFLGCKKNSAEEIAAAQHTQIENYVSKKNLTGQFTESGLWYTIDVEGTGVKPDASSTVKVKYSGYLLDQTPFDQSEVGGSTFSLTSVIVGWQEGVPKFKEGGEGLLIIPSELGYGSNAVGNIPPNSVLIFEVELIEVL